MGIAYMYIYLLLHKVNSYLSVLTPFAFPVYEQIIDRFLYKYYLSK